ncbi:hypothetical protein M413DRAFT_24631 [Hebeloma cylindrosporum]|uniref:Peptidase A1 domain-containing protein n=1 Tax=Hebeloma cylindrosporum TaxID=76867 RepID=A0A0C2YWP6_HEBCY|nr:hypothetical protein M413DRAFT_24631 [Hebeloma cylindrosporum h7]
MTPLAFSLPFLLFLGLSLAQEPIHIPLTRRSRVARTFNPTDEADRLRHRYGFANATTAVRRGPQGRRASSAGLSIINQNQDSSYLGTITVGTPANEPPQNILGIMQIASVDILLNVYLLAGTDCQRCPSSTPLYKSSQSTSFLGTGQQGNIPLGQDVTIRYGSGAVAGVTVADTVTILHVSHDLFHVAVSVDQVTSSLLQGSLSGILGLAFTAIASSGATPFWETLSSNNQLSASEMSFWLTRSTDATQTEVAGGVFTLGGTNSSLFSGDIEFLNMPVSTPSFWLLSMSAVQVDGTSVAISTGTTALAAIDTGTTLIGGPTADVAAIWAAVPGSAASQDSQGFFEFPCSTTVTISFSFGGKLWPISSQDMNLGQVSQGSSQCLGAIFDLSQGTNIPSGSGNPSWVVGDTFLKNVYSVFRANPASIGFASLSSLAGGSGAGSTSTPSSSASVLTPSLSITSTATLVVGASSTATSSKSNSGVNVMPSLTVLAALISGFLSAMFMLAL